jgi:hypothetical protein
MTTRRVTPLRILEGRNVSVALKDGGRIDDCELVSSGRKGAPKLWLYTNGEDVFVAQHDVLAVWEGDLPRRPAA